ncbi:expressed unknown protein [Seminavis robusta]|uniref:Uncharacterized protein n=1 Tax=Seminavis robusta TaxID=568900 RepID=A0A9N8DLV5_9STRA|nr:expressed unknown protein [Seminavis robusta]|eukprot:Sro197_g083880.1 n/a (257) ;mRNA; f:79009-79779
MLFDCFTERQLIRQGFVVCMVCCLWNMIGDLIYAPLYASGREILSPQLPVYLHQTENSHELLLLAQTSGWMYPIWGWLTASQLYIGLKPSESFWWSSAPCLAMAYAFCVIGGAQHSGWAFLTVLWQSEHREACLQNSKICQAYYEDSQIRIWKHFLMGDLPALWLFASSAWVFVSVIVNQSKGISFPLWFNLCNPLATQVWVMGLTYFLDPPVAGLVGGPFGTWMILTTNLGCAYCLWNHGEDDDNTQSSKKKKRN